MAVMAAAPRVTQTIPGTILGLAAGIATYFSIALFNRDLLQLAGNPLLIGPILASGSIADAIGPRMLSLLDARPADIGVIFVNALTLSVLLSIRYSEDRRGAGCVGAPPPRFQLRADRPGRGQRRGGAP